MGVALNSRDEKLLYLNKYFNNPEILTLDELNTDEKSNLADAWVEIISAKEVNRPKVALSYWVEFKDELDQTVKYLEKNLSSIDLIRYNSQLSLMYGVISDDGSEIIYHEGRNPKSKSLDNNLRDLWELLPASLQKFYELHNGWFHMASESMGLSPCENVSLLADDEWGILDEIGEQPIDMERTLSLFSNGMGDYVCIELAGEKPNCLIWDAKGPAKFGLDFWPVVDSWTVMGFE